MLDWNTINSSTFQISDKSLKVDLYIFQLFNKKKLETKFCQKFFDFQARSLKDSWMKNYVRIVQTDWHLNL